MHTLAKYCHHVTSLSAKPPFLLYLFLLSSPLEECDSGYLEQQVNGSVTSDPKHYAASNPLVRLPPELDRYVIKPVHADGATLGSATAMELTSDGAEGLLLADDGNVDETNIASGLAQVAELDELLERQIEVGV